MKILLVNHYAGSDRLGMEYRPFYLGREWVSRGHQVTIIAADQSHLRVRQPEVHEDLASSIEDGVCYRWIRTPRYVGSGVGRVRNMLVFVVKLAHYARCISRQLHPDIVICSSTYPLDIYPGGLIARYSGARLVYEVHDLWPLTPMLLGGYSRWHPYIQLLQHAEDRAYAQADAIVSILPDAKSYMIRRGMAASKFVHVPNGVPVTYANRGANFDLSWDFAPIVEKERSRGQFLVGYAGGLTLSMDINLLFDVAALKQASGVSFMIAGDGPKATELRTRLSSLQTGNVHMLGCIPKPAVPRFLAAMDLLVVPWHGSPLYQHGVSPNKIFDYMLAARPIIQASNASNDLITDARCGYTIPPGNPDALLIAINRVRGLSREERDRLGSNGRLFVCQNHDFRDLAMRFLSGVEQVTQSGRGYSGKLRDVILTS